LTRKGEGGGRAPLFKCLVLMGGGEISRRREKKNQVYRKGEGENPTYFIKRFPRASGIKKKKREKKKKKKERETSPPYLPRLCFGEKDKKKERRKRGRPHFQLCAKCPKKRRGKKKGKKGVLFCPSPRRTRRGLVERRGKKKEKEFSRDQRGRNKGKGKRRGPAMTLGPLTAGEKKGRMHTPRVSKNRPERRRRGRGKGKPVSLIILGETLYSAAPGRKGKRKGKKGEGKECEHAVISSKES